MGLMPGLRWARIAQWVSQLATDSTFRASNPGGGEIFRTRPERSWGPRNLLYNRYRVSVPGVKRPRLGGNHPPQSTAEVEERIEPYIYSHSGTT